jgi:hypothetical protein
MNLWHSYWRIMVMMCGLPTVVGLDLAGATHHSIPMIRYFWVFIFSFIMRPWIFFNNRTFYLVSWQVYWDWTWDELAAYDLPATFQYVHDQTGQNLHYVGHSQVNIALCLLSLFFCCSWEINYYRCRILFCIYIYICSFWLRFRGLWLLLLHFLKKSYWTC